MRRHALLVPLLFLVAALAAPTAEARRKRKPAPEKPRPATEQRLDDTPGRPTSPLAATVDDITRQVAALRGLSLVRPFGSGVLNREQIGQKLRERIQKEYSPEEIGTEARGLKRLGLLPPDADYQKLLIDILMEQVAGFYDPFTRQLYIADWIGSEQQRPAMVHEIEHALQDQHFDLKAFATPIKNDGDRQLARSALVEGDGTMVMLEFMMQGYGVDLGQLPDAFGAVAEQLASGQMAQTPILAAAPRFIRETLFFPYMAGMKFVAALRKGRPWSRIDEVWKTPPESTEQVLHPLKYTTHERPIAVAAAPLAALAPWKELRQDVLGEFEWKVLLASQLEDGVAERAAAGWGGDRMVIYGAPEPAAPVAVLNLSTWDTVEDAIEVESALRKLMARRLALPELPADSPAVFEVGGEAWSVERRGPSVLAIFGAPMGSRAQAATEVWREWKVAAKR